MYRYDEMKKILILGCSFTLGSYKSVGYNNSRQAKATGTNERLKNYKGWWYFVDYFKDNDITIFTCSGQGYWTYYQILLFLIEENKLNYDEIWIQETFEPRVTICDKKFLDKKLLDIDKILTRTSKFEFIHDVNLTEFRLHDFNLHEHLVLNPSTAKKENRPYTLWWTDGFSEPGFFNDISEMCSVKIDNLCKEKNIKGIVWSIHEPFMKCNHFTRLPVTLIKQKLQEKTIAPPSANLWTSNADASHQTEEGNKYIAKLINEACIDMMK